MENYEVNPTASLNVNLKEALASLPLAQENFSRAEVLLNVPYTLKPIELFNEEEAESIYHTSFYDSAHDRIFYDVAGNLGTALIYGISDAFLPCHRRQFPIGSFLIHPPRRWLIVLPKPHAVRSATHYMLTDMRT